MSFSEIFTLLKENNFEILFKWKNSAKKDELKFTKIFIICKKL